MRLCRRLNVFFVIDRIFFISYFFRRALHQGAIGAAAGPSPQRAGRIKLLTADPFDLEAQAKIEEEIR